MHPTWFLVFDRFQLLDVSGPLQVFASANEELVLSGRKAFYETAIYALQAGPVRSSSGVELVASALPRRFWRAVGSVFVPGGPGIWRAGLPVADLAQAQRLEALIDWVRRAAPRFSRIASVCTGAFVLARAGLLEGGSAVTHWALCEQLANEHPNVDVQRDAIYARQGRIWTSAGVTAGIDMALGMVEADVGREIAMSVAKKLVVFYKRPGGQSQFSSALLTQTADDARLDKLHAWMGSRLHKTISVPEMAEQLAMTPRTFARFYLQHTGVTPARAVARLRLEKACQLVEAGRQSLKAIAQQCGFNSEEVLRRAFMRHLRVSPTEYRERFAAR
ncbi:MULTISPECIES: helix-turn-helix domain-containing protein [unclassified Variovorax]|uniref:GlxA family transcriptional regulator n=1 Tax=unclassified Variovorax TaxID=663243 RepID=UPI002576EE9F|nr:MULTISPECIES: helix-turn-helix domain-containing protein [unclassified Variovorax]MDM0086728.1 helix-turn-helix domain-containing protein [Variovorax sp. J22G40]MDM0145016.1 helix-turn-helix domain-containing protein [Variovorax sp. J2P1-31]